MVVERYQELKERTLPDDVILEMDSRTQKAAQVAAAFALAHALLAGIGLYILQTRGPRIDASSQEITAFYQNDEDRRAVLFTAFYLMPFAGITFIWFINAFRTWLQRKTGVTRSVAYNVQLYASVGYVILIFASAAAIAVTPTVIQFTDGPYDDVSARLFPILGNLLFIVMGMKLVSMTVMTTSTVGRATGVLPSWFSWFGLGAGLVLILVPTISNWLFMVFLLWLVVLAILLLLDSNRDEEDESITLETTHDL